ncbi:hypothetical protein Moror_11556 [Moniliophthora roreri MCA 2997]|uniref:Uncharacterized protein n=1 Tax=Moniliophthora roreri (strain MCA 2997) TaxID=1381753 RepID=V2XQL3_MONRO|nr:hypothetical protein Moror_11556 [Moniliophthora roreri MCA 2997]
MSLITVESSAKSLPSDLFSSTRPIINSELLYYLNNAIVTDSFVTKITDLHVVLKTITIDQHSTIYQVLTTVLDEHTCHSELGIFYMI